jgi:hypothetical protein
VALQNQHALAAVFGQHRGGGQTSHAGADHNGIPAIFNLVLFPGMARDFHKDLNLKMQCRR